MMIMVITSVLKVGWLKGYQRHRSLGTARSKVMAMKDEAIVLTAAVIRLSPSSTNATNWHA